MHSPLSPSASQQHVTDFFESTAVYWKSVYSGDRLLPAIYQDRHRTALGWVRDLDLRPNARILEVGCGAGLLTLALARNGHTVDALDSTEAMRRMTRNGAVRQGVQSRIRIHAADVHALPFQAHAFDLVIAIGVIPWLHSERLALLEMQRVLKPGGHLLVTADNNARLGRILDPRSSPLSAPLRLAAKRLLRLCGLWSPPAGFQPKRHYPREIDRLMSECGFEHVHSCTVGFGPFTVLGKALLTGGIGVRLHRRLQTLASRRGVFLLRWTGSHYLVLVTKS
jgi:2-polyprenyl-3-methyl-5-hydroxy-6-metoxy-1,4-benzoquinol methylase